MGNLDIRGKLESIAPSGSEAGRWFPFGEHGLEVQVRSMTEEEFNSLSRRSQREQYHRHQRYMQVDVDKLNGHIIETALIGWRRMTGQIYAGYAHLSLDSMARECGLPREDAAKAEIQFDMQTALFLGRQCMGFADAIYNMARELVLEQVEAAKN